MHTTSKRITRCKQNSHALQTKLQHGANKRTTSCKQKPHTLQTKLQHVVNKRIIYTANKTSAYCKQNSCTLQTKAKTPHVQDDIKDWDLVLWFSCFTTNMAEFLQREIYTGVMKTQTPKTQTSRIFYLKKRFTVVNLSQFLSPNVLWSCNVHTSAKFLPRSRRESHQD